MCEAERVSTKSSFTEKLRKSQLRFFLLLVVFVANTVYAVAQSADTTLVQGSLLSLFEPQQLTVHPGAGAGAFLKTGHLHYLPVSTDDSIRIRKSNAQLTLSVIDSSGRVKLSTRSSEATITALEASEFELHIPAKIRRIVRGNITISAPADQSRTALRIVLTTPLEAFVGAIIAGEMSGEQRLEAFKALAVTARSFIVSHGSRHREEGFDFCDTTHCQVYRGEDDLRAQTAAPIIQATTETAGEVLTFNGRAIEGYYTAACGGISATPETVWGGRVASGYHFQPIACQWCASSPYKNWLRKAEVTPTLASLSSATKLSLSSLTEL